MAVYLSLEFLEILSVLKQLRTRTIGEPMCVPLGPSDYIIYII